MKSDFNPTIRSLIQQKAIRFIGDNERLKHFLKEYFDNVSRGNCKPSFEVSDTPIPIGWDYGETYNLTDYINLPLTKTLLYTIELQANLFTITAHIHSTDGINHQLIYAKKNPNLNYIRPTYHAIYRHLDNSNAFFICQRCNKLVATSERAVDGQSVCIDNHCNTTYKQDFDATCVDRISNTGNIVNVYKDEDKIKFYVASTYWGSPYQSCRFDRVIKTLPLGTTLDEVRAWRKKLEKRQPYPAPCFHCGRVIMEGEGENLSDFVKHKTKSKVCHGCMSKHYRVVF
ncbi:hypothetical protein J8L86_05475 [Shewanella sp. MMG014]|uniref:hypothetical protein n=1 Tax=Shewanella sp. MMG014 TaxID=2822691 RepID=UPI001B370287|nr:hypothetical protein [Shewanella sp. MMG014]MBQ4889287.1 hypothetical protein [Shewanella sp. MMG014]